jgi:TetR/AcrR family transcriptional repressor of nem operon
MAKRRDITRDDLLDEAERLMTACGFNGFSIRDVGEMVGISSASVHHYYPTKGDLAAAVLHRYRERWNAKLGSIAVEHEDWQGRVAGVVAAFAGGTARQSSGSLLAIACADQATLSSAAQAEARLLHENLTGWLARFIVEAKKHGEVAARIDAGDMAELMLSTLQGALLLSRIAGESAFVRAVAMLARLG